MSILNLKDINPYVRAVKIKKSSQLDGSWADIDHLLIYIAQGTCDYYYDNGKICHMKAGDCIVFPPFMRHELKRETNNSIVQYIVHFDLFEDESRIRIAHRPAGDNDNIEDLPECEKVLEDEIIFCTIPQEKQFQYERLFISMFQEFTDKEEGRKLMLKALCTQFLLETWRDSRIELGETEQPKIGTDKIVEKVKEYIFLHYDQELSNEELSEVAKVSSNYLSKLFRKHTGVTLHNYLINYRLERARQYILSGDYNITEVATKCGFSSIHVFSKVFKREWGMSPSEYIKVAGAESTVVQGKLDYDNSKHVFYNV